MQNTFQFIYQESEIHFLVNPNDRNVMINATEMAKAFGKKTELFLKADHTKSFISALKLQPNGGSLGDENDMEIIDFRGRNGIYFHRILALKFAAWLDPNFEVWIFSTIEDITFGNYKKHWDAHAEQEAARVRMEELKQSILLNPTVEDVKAYFETQNEFNTAKRKKTRAIKNQLNLFKN